MYVILCCAINPDAPTWGMSICYPTSLCISYAGLIFLFIYVTENSLTCAQAAIRRCARGNVFSTIHPLLLRSKHQSISPTQFPTLILFYLLFYSIHFLSGAQYSMHEKIIFFYIYILSNDLTLHLILSIIDNIT